MGLGSDTVSGYSCITASHKSINSKMIGKKLHHIMLIKSREITAKTHIELVLSRHNPKEPIDLDIDTTATKKWTLEIT